MTWTVQRAAELYQIDRWSAGYFAVGANGQVQVMPDRREDRQVDLAALVDDLVLRGISPPLLVRFGDMIESRIGEIYEAFERAIADHEYRGRYAPIYPIKVNQQRHVVENVLAACRRRGGGLEAGSKPELLAVLAMASDETPIVCNGFKDEEYIETVLLAAKVGRKILPVIERFEELQTVLRLAERYEQRPQLGIRVKLATRGSGRWEASGGYRSKFGLSAAETLEALERLQSVGMADCLHLLHFHVGSQITNIRQIKAAIAEAAHLYAELVLLGAGLEVLDVGGGLGVDYDGSQSDADSSVNYSLQEYANDIVARVASVCAERGVEHPDVYTECGRAMTAYHAVLVLNVLGSAHRGTEQEPEPPDAGNAQPVKDLYETLQLLSADNLVESYHDAVGALDASVELFRLGYLPLQQRAQAEALFWAILRAIERESRQLEEVPAELAALGGHLSEIYYCNFSVFRSLPDSWAIDQVFPIVPLQRLDEEPSQQAVLADISCDSDGKIDHFVGHPEPRPVLPVHSLREVEPYYLGVFLVGAYQEILGDLHNLLGHTNAVHVVLDEDGCAVLDEVVPGETVREVLEYVELDVAQLLREFRRDVERAVRAGRLTIEESGRLLRFYEEGLAGYTYLE